jgi:tetratricopeptide (TPR) repeat protein
VAFAFVGFLLACQSTPPPNPLAARSRLAPLLEAWERAQTEDGGCEERRPTETPLTDCEAVSNGIARLAIEFPRDPDILLAAAVVDFERGRKDNALKTLDVLRSVEAIHPEAAILRARIAIEEGNLRFARRLLDEQRELTPDHAGLWEMLASVAYLEEEYAKADRSLDIAARLGAPAWRVAYHRGLVAEASSRPERAIQAYEVCLEEAPDFAPARSRLRALVVMGEEWRGAESTRR